MIQFFLSKMLVIKLEQLNNKQPMNKTTSTSLNQELPLLINGSKQESNVKSSNQISGLPVVSLEKTELVSIFCKSHINSTESLFDVEINKVSTHPLIMNAYREKNLDGLKLTMKLVGQLEPIKVVQRQEEYLIFDGISRYLVAIELGWETIRVEVFDFTDDEIQDQYVLRNFRTKRSLIEMCNQAELILGVLGSSQGKKRDRIGNLTSNNDDFCLAGKERFQIACEVVGCDFSASSLRRLLAVKEFQENGDHEIKGLGLLEKLENGEMKINNAFSVMNSYTTGKEEQGTNELKETLRIIKEGNFELHNSTCEDLSAILDESVDCCVESPVYFQQRIYPDGVRDTSKRQLGLESSVDEYVQNQVEIHRGVFKKLKDTGSLFIVIADSFEKGEDCLVIEKLSVKMVESGWHCIQKWYWAKDNPKPQSNLKRLMPNYEIILHFVKDKDKYYWREFKHWKEGDFKAARGTKDIGMGKKRKDTSWTLARPLFRFRSFLNEQDVKNVIHANGFNWKQLKEIDPNFRHDAPYSEYIPLLPILTTTKVGDTVLDIYNGCGTTTSVASYLRRKAIGFDTDTKSHEFATKRLRLVERDLPTENEIQEFENDYLEPAA